MKNYTRIMNLIYEFLRAPCERDIAEAFCNEYMDMFNEVFEDLQKKLSATIYNSLDEINWICDSYEKDETIRATDNYCIDENMLRNKINNAMDKIEKMNF